MSNLHIARSVRTVNSNKEESKMAEEQKFEEEYDDIMDDEVVDETEVEESDDDDEDEDIVTLDMLDKNDPIQGPVYNFITALLDNASLPIESYRVRICLGIDKSSDDTNDDLEQIAEVVLGDEKRLDILKANVNQLLAIMNNQAIDFSKVEEIRQQYGDEDNKGFVDISIDELASQEGNEVDYIDYMQRIIPGVKSLYKENPTGVIKIVSSIVDWAKQQDCVELYDDIMKCGGKIMKQVMWSALKQ